MPSVCLTLHCSVMHDQKVSFQLDRYRWGHALCHAFWVLLFWLAMHVYHSQLHMAVLAAGNKYFLCLFVCPASNHQQCRHLCCPSEAVVTCLQDTEALQQQVALLKLAAQDGVVALQKQLANAIAERDVAHEQIRAAEQQAAAETAHRVRLEGSAHDVQQQLSRQTAEASKAQQAYKKLHEQVHCMLAPSWQLSQPSFGAGRRMQAQAVC